MADTIVNRRGSSTDVTDSAVGWVIAAIVILALAIGFIALFRHNTTPATPNTGVPAQQVTPAQSGGGNPSGVNGGSGATTPSNSANPTR